MPEGKVKSFLVVNDIFKLAMMFLLRKGWENLLQSEKLLTVPSLFIQGGAWLQRATSDGWEGTGVELEVVLGVPFPCCPSRSLALAVSPRRGWGQAPGDGADVCSLQDPNTCMGAWMFDLALSPLIQRRGRLNCCVSFTEMISPSSVSAGEKGMLWASCLPQWPRSWHEHLQPPHHVGPVTYTL